MNLPNSHIMEQCRSIAAIDYCFNHYLEAGESAVEKLEKLKSYRQVRVSELKLLLSNNNAAAWSIEEFLELTSK